MEMTRILWTTTLILLFIISLFNCGMSFAAKRYPIPIQISSAPCYGMITESYGEGSQKYWIFRPAAPGKYPVVVFLHGWAATEPLFYMAWIRHLVREGNIVVYPRYQNLLDLSSEKFTDNAANSIKDALKKLKGKYDGRFYIVGHRLVGL